MGQKINPISLRININRNFDSCWYQDNSIKYSQLLHQDLNIREYLKSLFNYIGIHTGRITFQFFQKKLVINYFFHDSHKKNFQKKLTFSSIKFKQLLALEKSFQSRYIEKYLSFIIQNQKTSLILKKNVFLRTFLTYYFFSQNQNIFSTKQYLNCSNDYLMYDTQHKFFEGFAKGVPNVLSSGVAVASSSKPLNTVSNSFTLQNEILNELNKKRTNFTIDKNLANIEYIISKNIQSNIILLPLKIGSRFQSAQFIAEYVCQRLQDNITFRQIFKQLLQDIKNDLNIQGMRIVCAGRLNGVEMARVESKKFGQTSLHIFSSKIDYASSQAYTLFGLLGVKVWLCFKS
jgi:ribosomal protein S3